MGGGVAPIYMALTWKKASATGAITGCISGLCFGLLAWLVTCQGYYGSITIDNLGGDYPMLAGALPVVAGSLAVRRSTLCARACVPPAPCCLRLGPPAARCSPPLAATLPSPGNLASICSSLIICTLISLWRPQNYDWCAP